jgi:hypothetical protein
MDFVILDELGYLPFAQTGNWRRPSGRIFELGDANPARLDTLAIFATW